MDECIAFIQGNSRHFTVMVKRGQDRTMITVENNETGKQIHGVCGFTVMEELSLEVSLIRSLL